MNFEEKLSLDGKWRLGLISEQTYRTLPAEIKTLSRLEAYTRTMEGTVPGNFELDLQANGIIGDPFFGDQYLSLARYEDSHVFYGRKFEYKGDTANRYLVFSGIDTIADIYLNGKKFAHVENMFVPHEFRADGLVSGENEILIHIVPVCVEARKYPVSVGNLALRYNYESLRVRKALADGDMLPYFGGIKAIYTPGLTGLYFSLS